MELTPRPRRLAGLDLGQRDDYTALPVIEQEGETLTLVVLERVRHKPYPDVADLVHETMVALEYPALLVDVTGVGRPVCDLLTRKGVGHTRVSIHGGSAITTLEDGTQSIPKRDLVGALVVGFESGRLRIAAGLRHVESLEREAQAFQMKLSAAGHDSYSARSGEHDDLLLAVALPVWHVLAAKPSVAGAFAMGSAVRGSARRADERWIRTNGGDWQPARRPFRGLEDLYR